VSQRQVTLGDRGEAVFDGRPGNAVEIADGASDGMLLLRATAGRVRDGTPVKLSGSEAPAPAASAASVAVEQLK